MGHLTTADLDAALEHVTSSPTDVGVLALIVRRPLDGEREVLAEAVLDLDEGLVGDNWRTRGSRHTADGSPEADKQLNVMNVRLAEAIAGGMDRVPLAGDQLYLDLDVSVANLPPGTRLSMGEAVIEVTPSPHTGCAKFTKRFGLEAMRYVNSPTGKDLRLRGLCARVVAPGTVRTGDTVTVSRPGT
ncbi:MAG: MOSC domain-containing protein [Acidimicrobiales bacterium]